VSRAESWHDAAVSPTPHRFVRVVLRTTDVPAAESFYAAVLGPGLAPIVELPAAAIARGARPHWLGQIGVDDVEGTAAAFAAQGATRLGGHPGVVEVLRDPGGAIVSVSRLPETPPALMPVWHQLFASDPERTIGVYGALFGWTLGERSDLGEHGVHWSLAYEAGGSSVGSIADVATVKGAHTHWLFHFAVPSLDEALATVRARGGVTLGPWTLPGGARMAACDDAQGAAFALREG
jgi:predicted enzyme related to lactoylglutathione lyase